MKKFLLAVALICATTAVSAQKKTFQYGFKGGLNFTTYSSDADDVQAHMGQWGAICRFNIGESFSIQPEIFYSRQGVRSLEKYISVHSTEGRAFATGDYLETEKYKLGLLTDNIQMPIMCKYYLPVERWKGLNIQVGPQFSQRFDYKITSPSQKGYLSDPRLGTYINNKGEQTAINTKYFLARDMNYFTMAANFGLGFDSESGIGVDLRCSWGLTPVFRNYYNPNSKDRVYSISFTYVF